MIARVVANEEINVTKRHSIEGISVLSLDVVVAEVYTWLLGVVIHACDPTTREAGGSPLVGGQPGLHSETLFQKKKKKKKPTHVKMV